jgi:hypothetical protein
VRHIFGFGGANVKKIIDENDKLYTNNKKLWGII